MSYRIVPLAQQIDGQLLDLEQALADKKIKDAQRLLDVLTFTWEQHLSILTPAIAPPIPLSSVAAHRPVIHHTRLSAAQKALAGKETEAVDDKRDENIS